jgi:hypothetical protein
MAAEIPPAPDERLIEFGASHSEGTLRYWLAKEAVSKGELFLGSQIGALRVAWLCFVAAPVRGVVLYIAP